MAYYVKFEFFLPVYPESQFQRNRDQALLIRELRKFASRKYGGSTMWNPQVPGFLGEWESEGETVSDEVVPLWVFVKAGWFDEALRTFADWKREFENRLKERVIAVTYHLIQTIGDLETEDADLSQLALFKG